MAVTKKQLVSKIKTLVMDEIPHTSSVPMIFKKHGFEPDPNSYIDDRLMASSIHTVRAVYNELVELRNNMRQG